MKEQLVNLSLLLLSAVLVYLSLGSTGKAYVFSSYVIYPLALFMIVLLFLIFKR
jgi:hypothetical protein